jgi:DUF2975 family protein
MGLLSFPLRGKYFPFKGNFLLFIDKYLFCVKMGAMFKNFFLKYKFKLISIVGVILFVFFNPADNRRSQNERILNDSKIKSTQTLPKFYQTLIDSIEQVNRYMTWRLTTVGNSLTTPLIGISKIEECDTCNSFRSSLKSPGKSKYFVALPNYTIRQNASYYIEKDKYYVDYFVPDSASSVEVSVGHYENKEIKIRYAVGDSDQGGTILIPVSKNAYHFYHVLTLIMMAVLIIVGVFIVLVFPFSILLNIAYGEPFKRSNIRNLSLLGWFLLAVPIVSSIIPLIIGFFLRNDIPDQFYFPFGVVLMESKTWLIAGLAVLLLASAFKQGYKLQQDQDLTI